MADSPTLTADLAASFARTALANVVREYPNQARPRAGERARPAHAARPASRVPRQLRLAFVRAHALAAGARAPAAARPAAARRNRRRVRPAPHRRRTSRWNARISRGPKPRTFERTYGWSWLLELAHGIAANAGSGRAPLGQPRSRRWRRSSSRAIATTCRASAIRCGRACIPTARSASRSRWTTRSRRTTTTFARLVPCHRAALVRRRSRSAGRLGAVGCGFPVASLDGGRSHAARPCPAARFAAWLDGFPAGRHGAGDPRALPPVVVDDRADPLLVHLDGLNLSRAWCLHGHCRRAAGRDDARREPLRPVAAERHRRGRPRGARKRRLRRRALARHVRGAGADGRSRPRATNGSRAARLCTHADRHARPRSSSPMLLVLVVLAGAVLLRVSGLARLAARRRRAARSAMRRNCARASRRSTTQVAHVERDVRQDLANTRAEQGHAATGLRTRSRRRARPLPRRDAAAAHRHGHAAAAAAGLRSARISAKLTQSQRAASRRGARDRRAASRRPARRQHGQARADARDGRREAAGHARAAARRIVQDRVRSPGAGASRAGRDAVARDRGGRPEARARERQDARHVGRSAARGAALRSADAAAVRDERRDGARQRPARRVRDPPAGARQTTASRAGCPSTPSSRSRSGSACRTHWNARTSRRRTRRARRSPITCAARPKRSARRTSRRRTPPTSRSCSCLPRASTRR